MNNSKEYDVIGSRGDVYKVTNPNDGTDWICSCPHHTHRKVECKHIKQIKESLKDKNENQSK